MKILVVYAHPNPQSFNNAILRHIVQGLNEVGHDLIVIDLYKENFDPRLRFDSDKKRRDLHLDPETEHYRKLISEAEHVIFIYPIWWYGQPAILKGFIDRVFSSGFAYTYKGNLPKGLLRNKTAWVVYTIDSPKWYISMFRLNAEWITMKNAVLKFCGFRKIKRFVFSGLKHSNKQEREKWLSYLYNQAKSLR